MGALLTQRKIKIEQSALVRINRYFIENAAGPADLAKGFADRFLVRQRYPGAIGLMANARESLAVVEPVEVMGAAMKRSQRQQLIFARKARNLDIVNHIDAHIARQDLGDRLFGDGLQLLNLAQRLRRQGDALPADYTRRKQRAGAAGDRVLAL